MGPPLVNPPPTQRSSMPSSEPNPAGTTVLYVGRDDEVAREVQKYCRARRVRFIRLAHLPAAFSLPTTRLLALVEVSSPADLASIDRLSDQGTIVGLGAVESITLLENALELGADDVLVQPLRPTLIARRLTELLRPTPSRTTGRFRVIRTSPAAYTVGTEGTAPAIVLGAALENVTLPAALIFDGILHQMNDAFRALVPISDLPVPQHELVAWFKPELRALPTQLAPGTMWSSSVHLEGNQSFVLEMHAFAAPRGGALVTLRDTESSRSEEHARAAELSDFIGSLLQGWHDRLGSPIGLLSANVAFVTEQLAPLAEKLSEQGACDLKEALKESEDALSYLRALLADMQLMIVGTAGKAERTEIRPLLESVTRYVSAQLPKELRFSLSVSVPESRLVERSRVAQVLSHLLLALAPGTGHRNEIDQAEIHADAFGDNLVIHVVMRQLMVDSDVLRDVNDISQISEGSRESAAVHFCRLVLQSMGGQLQMSRLIDGGTSATLTLPAPRTTPRVSATAHTSS